MSAGSLHVRPVPILRKSTAFLQNCVHHVKPPHPVPPTIRPGASSRHPDNKHPRRHSLHHRPGPLLPPGPISRHRRQPASAPSLGPRRHRRSRGHRRGHCLTCSPAPVSAPSPSSTATSSNPPTSSARSSSTRLTPSSPSPKPRPRGARSPFSTHPSPSTPTSQTSFPPTSTNSWPRADSSSTPPTTSRPATLSTTSPSSNPNHGSTPPP